MRVQPSSRARASSLARLFCTSVASTRSTSGITAWPAAAACTIVYGQGRNASDDERANALWDDANVIFNNRIAARLAAGGGPAVIPLVLRVTATDVQGNLAKLLSRAREEDCTRIVETSMFADYEAQAFVARIRVHPIVRDGEALRIGAPQFVSERNFQLTRSTLERVKPALLADEMAAEIR